MSPPLAFLLIGLIVTVVGCVVALCAGLSAGDGKDRWHE